MTDPILWHVTHADGRTAVVRAASGPLAMQCLGWRAATFDVLPEAGPDQIVMQAPAPVPQHDPQQHIDVLSEGFEELPEWPWPKPEALEPIMDAPWPEPTGVHAGKVEWDPQP